MAIMLGFEPRDRRFDSSTGYHYHLIMWTYYVTANPNHPPFVFQAELKEGDEIPAPYMQINVEGNEDQAKVLTRMAMNQETKEAWWIPGHFELTPSQMNIGPPDGPLRSEA